MLTDTKSPSMRVALQQIYVNLYVEYGKRKISPIFSGGALPGAQFPLNSDRLSADTSPPFQSSRTPCPQSSIPEGLASTMSSLRSPWNSLWYVTIPSVHFSQTQWWLLLQRLLEVERG